MALRFFVSLLAGLFAAPGALAQKESDDPLAKEIPNLSRSADGRFAYAGQPSEDGFASLKEAGFKTIINLREEKELSFDEKKVVEDLGMSYVHIPITTFSITEEKVTELADSLRDPEGAPVLIHCGASNRVGGMWYIYRALYDGLSEEDAMKEALEHGLSSTMLTQVVKRYVSKRK